MIEFCPSGQMKTDFFFHVFLWGFGKQSYQALVSLARIGAFKLPTFKP